MKRVLLISFLVITVSLFVGSGFIKLIKSRCKYYNLEFSGYIDNIKYTEQKYVFVKINDAGWYYLGNDVNYFVEIEIGDSILKMERDITTLLFKNGKKFDITSNQKTIKFLKHCPPTDMFL
jgi:hypothetical protein